VIKADLATLIDILRGSANATVRSRGHEQLAVFGLGRDIAETQWRSPDQS